MIAGHGSTGFTSDKPGIGRHLKTRLTSELHDRFGQGLGGDVETALASGLGLRARRERHGGAG